MPLWAASQSWWHTPAAAGMPPPPLPEDACLHRHTPLPAAPTPPAATCLPRAPRSQYPGLQAAVAADLATMLTLADAAFRLFPATSWRWLFEELRRQAGCVAVQAQGLP